MPFVGNAAFPLLDEQSSFKITICDLKAVFPLQIEQNRRFPIPLRSQFVILKHRNPPNGAARPIPKSFKITICDLKAADPAKLSRKAGSQIL